MTNKSEGVAKTAVIAVVAVAIVIGGVAYYNLRPEAEKMMDMGEDMMHDGEGLMEEGKKMINEGKEMMDDAKDMMKDEDGAMMEDEGKIMEESMTEYNGTVLSGNTSVLLDFDKADYDRALSSDKLITLYFYANWCPICKEEFPKMESAFDSLNTDSVIGFRVNFNDNETDDFEEQLARDFGVAYQHTKVFVKNGERVLKSPESWDENRYLSEINKLIN